MIVSTILLTRDDHYVDSHGILPLRPSHDKTLLRELVRGQIISPEAIEMLPASICNVGVWDNTQEPTIGITILEIDALTDLLIVSRSNGIILDGKKFRFDNFTLLVKCTNIEIWKRK